MPIYKTGTTQDGKQGYRVRINFTDSHGNYRTKTKIVYGAQEAKNEEQKMLYETRTDGSADNKTVQELYEEYVHVKQFEVRETTLATFSSVLTNNVLPYCSTIKLSKLNAKTLQEWKNALSKSGKKLVTKNNAYKAFRTLLNFAVKMEYLPKNPLLTVGAFKDAYFEHTEEKIHYYTPEQFRKFITVAESHDSSLSDYAYFVFFNIAYYMGMRKGEINALKWTDIKGNLIHVKRSVTQKIKGKNVVETPPKNKSSFRTLQMPKKLISILNEQRNRQKQTPGFSEDFRVCGGASCLSDTGISNKNIQYAAEAELPVIRIHDFRHSHASLLANEGINIQEIARRLGHSNVSITWNTYSHLYPREEERAVSVLDRV